MSDLNAQHNRVVWCDMPVIDLNRANAFYSAVLNIEVEMEGRTFSVLEHSEGNGCWLVPGADEITGDKGILVYMNVNGRIREAVGKVEGLGGTVVEPIHGIGPHGFRSIIRDSEGNRIALHSNTDE